MNPSSAALGTASHDKRQPQHLELPSPSSTSENADASLFAAMRFILAFAGFAIIYIDPTEPSSNEAFTYGAFALYSAYAAIVLACAWTRSWLPDQRLLCALDVAFAALLVLWTHGTDSIFFYVFLFPILVVSFSHGYRDGMLFTVASVATFIVAGSLAEPPLVQYELNLTLIRPVYLLALGYMIARWGGRERLFKRRLMLLREVNSSSARAAVDEVIGANLRRLSEFDGTDRCVLVLRRAGPEPRHVLYAAGGSAHGAGDAQEMSLETGERLLSFPESASILYRSRPRLWGSSRSTCVTYGCKGERGAGAAPLCELVAALLEARHFVAVPYVQADGSQGRLFLTSNRRRYTRGDAQFLRQFAAAVSMVVDNLQLIDELISTAAAQERTMISRDIHDATVQPYIGLRLALEALHREGGADNPLAPKILDLVEMANATVRELRGYTRTLVAGCEVPGASLGAAISMQADRHRRFFGLDVSTDIDAASGELTGRVASQLFYVVVEALTNIVKHTSARRAFIEVRSGPNDVSISIGNEDPGGRNVLPGFVPKSIKSRVEALRGTLQVQRSPAGYTVVQATIPSQP